MLSWINRKILKILGWKITGVNPNDSGKNIVLVIPHTSAWDFPLGICLRSACKFDIKYVGKSSLFKPPFGFIMKWLGGLPVERNSKSNTTDQIVALFEKADQLSICIAPEGTRKKVKKIKTGFYYIAKKANIPLILTKFDFKNKIVDFGEPRYVLDTINEELEYIWNYFKGVEGKVPKFSITEDFHESQLLVD